MPISGSGGTGLAGTGETTADLIAETRRHLIASSGEVLNRLAADIDDTATTLTFDFPLAGIKSGARLSVDLEVMHVWSVDNLSATVERGRLGSLADDHAAGAIVSVNPAYTDYAIFAALNHELRALSSPSNGLFRVLSTDVTFSSVVAGYDLAGVDDITEPYALYYRTPGPAKDWPRIPRQQWRYLPNMATGEFASTRAIVILGGGYPGMPVHVVYKAPFGLLTATTDDVAVVTGLPSTAMDIPPLGAAIRLASPREVRRNATENQGDTRRAEEVPAGAVAASANALRADRERRIADEASRLAEAYPYVSSAA